MSDTPARDAFGEATRVEAAEAERDRLSVEIDNLNCSLVDARQERDEARAENEKLREALTDYAERLKDADAKVTALMGEAFISDRLGGKREGIRLAIDHFRTVRTVSQGGTDQ